MKEKLKEIDNQNKDIDRDIPNLDGKEDQR